MHIHSAAGCGSVKVKHKLRDDLTRDCMISEEHLAHHQHYPCYTIHSPQLLSPEAATKSMEWGGLFCAFVRVWWLVGVGEAHRSSQIHSRLSVGAVSRHDAPERSPSCEITFSQPSHAWLECVEWKKAATEQRLVGRISGGKEQVQWRTETLLLLKSAAVPLSL